MVPIPLRDVDPVEGVFDEIEIARHGDDLFISINGTLVFSFACSDRTKHQLTIRVPKGVAYVADVELAELVE